MLYLGNSQSIYLNSLKNNGGVDVYIRNVIQVMLYDASCKPDGSDSSSFAATCGENEEAINPIKRESDTSMTKSIEPTNTMYSCVSAYSWKAQIVKYDKDDQVSDWVITSVTITNGITNPSHLANAIITIGYED